MTRLLDAYRSEIAEYVTNLFYPQDSTLVSDYNRNRCREDMNFHVNYLSEAVNLDSPDFFAEYVVWVNATLTTRSISGTALLRSLNMIVEYIQDKATQEELLIVRNYVDFAGIRLAAAAPLPLTVITDANPYCREARAFVNHLIAGQRADASQVVEGMITNGIDLRDIYEHVFRASQYEVGLLWQSNRITVAHELFCTAATQLIMAGLYPRIFRTQRGAPTLVACCVTGELHEMGIRMVADHFEMEGWDTHCLGANMPARHLLDSVFQHNAVLLAVSVTLPVHIRHATELISMVRSDTRLSKVKVLDGGYSFGYDPKLWRKSGADLYASSAAEAVQLANDNVR